LLETQGINADEALLGAWRSRAERARAQLGWRMPGVVARPHARGASLALAAPVDQLLLATEVNEWALCASLLALDPERWQGLEAALIAEASEALDPAAPAPVLDEGAAFARFRELASSEA
jgi:hypothetical protein